MLACQSAAIATHLQRIPTLPDKVAEAVAYNQRLKVQYVHDGKDLTMYSKPFTVKAIKELDKEHAATFAQPLLELETTDRSQMVLKTLPAADNDDLRKQRRNLLSKNEAAAVGNRANKAKRSGPRKRKGYTTRKSAAACRARRQSSSTPLPTATTTATTTATATTTTTPARARLTAQRRPTTPATPRFRNHDGCVGSAAAGQFDSPSGGQRFSASLLDDVSAVVSPARRQVSATAGGTPTSTAARRAAFPLSPGTSSTSVMRPSAAGRAKGRPPPISVDLATSTAANGGCRTPTSPLPWCFDVGCATECIVGLAIDDDLRQAFDVLLGSIEDGHVFSGGGIEPQAAAGRHLPMPAPLPTPLPAGRAPLTPNDAAQDVHVFLGATTGVTSPDSLQAPIGDLLFASQSAPGESPVEAARPCALPQHPPVVQPRSTHAHKADVNRKPVDLFGPEWQFDSEQLFDDFVYNVNDLPDVVAGVDPIQFEPHRGPECV